MQLQIKWGSEIIMERFCYYEIMNSYNNDLLIDAKHSQTLGWDSGVTNVLIYSEVEYRNHLGRQNYQTEVRKILKEENAHNDKVQPW